LKFWRQFHVFADYIVGNSNKNLEYVRAVNKLVPEYKYRLIYNIVDFDKWYPSKHYSPERKEKLKIVVAASHLYRKNLIGLLKALVLLDERELEKIHIDWYGDRLTKPFIDNSFLESLDFIKSNGLDNTISFFPATHDINLKVQKADIVALFSLSEGIPNAVCEAMSCSKPVICSSISDIPEILSYNDNLLFNPEDPQSISKSLSYIINLSNTELMEIGKKNYLIARELFNKEKIVTEYIKLFKE
jgi:glycosyltransferase involved in cell wall biosynthesis